MAIMINPAWLVRGNFSDLATSTPPVMQDVREKLCRRLGLPPRSLRIRSFPPGPTLKHCYWWREGEENYSEAQFLAELSRSHPVLSLGISVEKGRESPPGSTKATRRKPPMKRPEWDWNRFVSRLPKLLTTDLPAVAAKASSPVHLRIRSKPDSGRASGGWELRTFSLTEGNWFQRHYGPVDATAICDYVIELDRRKKMWVIAQMTRDFFPEDAKRLTAGRIAEVLVSFDDVRRRMRRTSNESTAGRSKR